MTQPTAKSPRKPRNLQAVLIWLSHHGLEVIGPAVNLSKGWVYPGCQNYGPAEIERYVQLKRAGTLVEKDLFDDEEQTLRRASKQKRSVIAEVTEASTYATPVQEKRTKKE